MIRTYEEFKKVMGYVSAARVKERGEQQRRDWFSIGAIIGLSSGIIAAITGSLLTAITWFTGKGTGSAYAHMLGTILLIMTIPLLGCGAHCLDLADKRKDRQRESRFNEH